MSQCCVEPVGAPARESHPLRDERVSYCRLQQKKESECLLVADLADDELAQPAELKVMALCELSGCASAVSADATVS